jgi:mRNA-degrading endonuclease RelE of RelBE toxin-antitoxin system
MSKGKMPKPPALSEPLSPPLSLPLSDRVEIQYSKQADKFFAKHHALSKEEARMLLVKAVRQLLQMDNTATTDVKPLSGPLKGSYRIRKGNVRIVFSYRNGSMIIVSVEAIDVRGNVYG